MFHCEKYTFLPLATVPLAWLGLVWLGWAGVGVYAR